MARAATARPRTTKAQRERSQSSRQRSAARSAGNRAAPPATPPSRSGSTGLPSPHRKNRCSSPLSPKIVERRHIHRIEALANPEQEDADDDEGYQDREGDADFDDEWHALGSGGRQHQPVLERHEAYDLADGIAARHHHQKAEQYDRQRKGEILARQRVGIGRDPQH